MIIDLETMIHIGDSCFWLSQLITTAKLFSLRCAVIIRQFSLFQENVFFEALSCIVSGILFGLHNKAISSTKHHNRRVRFRIGAIH